MKPLAAVTLLSLVLASCNYGREILPEGSVNHIDRELNEAEWGNAHIVYLNDSVLFKAMKNKDLLFLSVDFISPDSLEYRWVEVYIDTGIDVLRLHASGQLGQQVHSEQAWNDEWNWGNNDYWTATKHGLNTLENRGYEFSLQRKLFDQPTLNVMVVSFLADKTKGFSHPPTQLTFPENAENNVPSAWYQLRLD